jgi:hypothetical protein
MSDNHALEGPDQRNAEHELWLAMQAAYNKYRNASSELDILAVQPSGAENLQIETATSEQWSAFENYIETRMQYSEFRCDQNNARSRSFGNSQTVGDSTVPSEGSLPRRGWTGSTISRPALATVVVVLLCINDLSVAYLMRFLGFAHGARTTRDEIGATLNQARNDIQTLGEKIDAINVSQQFLIRASILAPTAPVRPRRTSVTKAAERKSSGNRLKWRIQTPFLRSQRRSNVAGTQMPVIPVSSLVERSYWTFTLPLSRQFEVVGPVRLSLRSVNLKYKYFDLCVMANQFKIDHVNLGEPVSITLTDPSVRVELVATQIDKNHVRGYVSELKYRKSELTASQARRRPSGGS